MALGRNTDNNKKNYSPNVYSAYTFSNSNGVIDSTRLSASFFNKMLKLTIEPKKDGSTVENPDWDTDNGISIYLTHTKARMLYDEICEFQKDRKGNKNLGVPSGVGLISISNGSEFGEDIDCLVLRKLNGDTGEVEASYVYEFKTDYHYAIRNFEHESKDFDKIYYNNLEIEQFKTLLESYYVATTNAIAASVIDNMKYDVSRVNTKLDSVCEKLGIEYNNSKSNYSNKSYFNNRDSKTPSSSSSFSSGSIDDLIEG